MAICPLTQRCRFFKEQLGQHPEAAEKVRQFYCLEHFQRCARLVYVRMSEAPAPPTLLPNDLQWVADQFGWPLQNKA